MPNAADTDKRFDILVPVDIYRGLGFHGRPAGSSAVNSEIAFSVFGWRASFHETATFRYLVVRTNCSKQDAGEAIDKIVEALPFASIILDIGIRSSTSSRRDGDYAVDMTANSIFPAGLNPMVYGGAGSSKSSVDIAVLDSAFDISRKIPREYRKAAEVFSDVDFESTTTSRLTLLATALEMICGRGTRDSKALAILDRWARHAKCHKRDDLVTAVGLMKQESIASAIRSALESAGRRASLEDKEIDRLKRRAVELHRLRSQVVHGGADPSPANIVELRNIVRFLLTGDVDRGQFSGARESLLY
jgi:hypothetical protein